MLRWLNQRRRGGSPVPTETPVDNSAAELEFLRGQSDFDAEEMSSAVRPGGLIPRAETDCDLEARSGGDDPGATRPGLRLPVARSSEAWSNAPTVLTPQEEGPGQLVLAVIIHQHSSLLTVRDSALIGREDPEQGRTPEVDLSLDDAVSRRHARIYRQGGQYFVQELGSTNGTCLNGEWVITGRDEPLRTGDIILLGEASELQVLTVSFGTELSEEDRRISDLLHQAQGELSPGRPAARSHQPGAPVDMLDVALSRGVEAGLLEQEDDWEYPAARPEWRLREFDGLELPSLVEPYR
ncbi:MAG: FHA domain-containing protein [Actinomycetota bacterium]